MLVGWAKIKAVQFENRNKPQSAGKRKRVGSAGLKTAPTISDQVLEAEIRDEDKAASALTLEESEGNTLLSDSYMQKIQSRTGGEVLSLDNVPKLDASKVLKKISKGFQEQIEGRSL